MFSFLSFTHCISLTILYEKKVEKTVEQTYRIYIEQLIKSINSVTSKKNISFEIDRVQSYSSYVNSDDFTELSGYAGESDINARIATLQKMKIDNYIFAITTNLFNEMEEYQTASPCKINYIFNLDSQLNYDNDLLSNLQFCLRHALGKVLKLDGMIPNLLNTQDKKAHTMFEDYINKIDEVKLFASCHKEKEPIKIEDDEDNNLDRLESLLSNLKGGGHDTKENKKVIVKNKNKPIETKNDTGLILKSLQQMRERIEQIDDRIKDVEQVASDGRIKRSAHSRVRHIGSFEKDNLTPLTMSNHASNYQPFSFAKKEVKKNGLEPPKEK